MWRAPLRPQLRRAGLPGGACHRVGPQPAGHHRPADDARALGERAVHPPTRRANACGSLRPCAGPSRHEVTRRGWVLLLVLGATWGDAYPLTKLALRDLD